jgi:hypothetical protein
MPWRSSLLRHGTPQAAQRAFDLSQVTEFLAQSHIINCDFYIAICNFMSSNESSRISAA